MTLGDNHPEQSVRSEVGFIGPIEGLRGVAVLWVMLFHYLRIRDPKLDDPWNAAIAARRPLEVIVGNGYLGVDLFFLITGFLLVLPWARHAAAGLKPPNARDFYVRRIRRIVPAYYVQLYLLFVLFIPLLRGFDYWRYDIAFLSYNALAHVLFLHYTTPLSSASLSANGPLWSLALEFQYYLILPLLAPLVVRAPLRGAAVLAGVAIAWHWLARNDLAALVHAEMLLGARWHLGEDTIRHLILTQLPGYMAHFAAGILAGLAWFRLAGRVAKPLESAAWIAISLLCLALLYWLYVLGGGAIFGEASWFATVVAFALIIFGLVSRNGGLARVLLANRPLAFAGKVSYSAYLYHMPLLLLWNKYFALQASPLSLPLYVAVVLAVSWASFRLVEQPFIRRRERLALALPAGLAAARFLPRGANSESSGSS